MVQLRRDNALGTLYNIVGFQTKMKHGAQTEVFRMIPGLENAAFARLGGIHRNTFLNSPRLLDGQLRLRADPRLRFAGQVTGVEGYVESAAMGLLAGRLAAAERLGRELAPPPETTATGALLRHITGGADARTFQPMNVNFGLFPPLDDARGGRRGRRERYKGYTDRAKADFRRLAGARRRCRPEPSRGAIWCDSRIAARLGGPLRGSSPPAGSQRDPRHDEVHLERGRGELRRSRPKCHCSGPFATSPASRAPSTAAAPASAAPAPSTSTARRSGAA